MDNVPTKSPGNEYTSPEFNPSNDELKNAVTATDQMLGIGDQRQLSKSMVNYSGVGDFYNETGVANAYVLVVVGARDAPTALKNGLRARFIASNSNTAASTLNLVGFGLKSIKKYGGLTDLEPGDIIAARNYEVSYVSSGDHFELVTIENPLLIESIPLFMTVTGMKLSQNTVSPTTDIDIAPGSFKDTNTFNAFTLNSTFIKQLDNVWAPGSGAGGLASAVPYVADKWYHVFAIGTLAGAVDVGFDDNVAALNLLANASGFTFFRRIGSIKTELATTNILDFYNQVSVFSGERTFYWKGSPAEGLVLVVAPALSTPTSFTVLTPPGFEVRADITAGGELLKAAGPGGDFEISLISPLRGAAFIRKVSIRKDTITGTPLSFDAENDVIEYTNDTSELVHEVTEAGAAAATDLTLRFRTNGWIE